MWYAIDAPARVLISILWIWDDWWSYSKLWICLYYYSGISVQGWREAQICNKTYTYRPFASFLNDGNSFSCKWIYTRWVTIYKGWEEGILSVIELLGSREVQHVTQSATYQAIVVLLRKDISRICEQPYWTEVLHNRIKVWIKLGTWNQWARLWRSG